MTDAVDIQDVVDAEVARRDAFVNLHGITIDNLGSFLVTPFEVRVDPDDLETGVRSMWIVLQEFDDATRGYVVVYDASTETWGVTEHSHGGNYVLVNDAGSFAEALSSM